MITEITLCYLTGVLSTLLNLGKRVATSTHSGNCKLCEHLKAFHYSTGCEQHIPLKLCLKSEIGVLLAMNGS